jgi:AraC-like DNA-binding protein
MTATGLAGPLEFRATDVPAAAREDYWRHVLGETLGPLEPVDVPDRVRVGDLGAVRVGELSQRRPGGARRTARHLRGVDRELCKVDVLSRGRGVVAQDGREAALAPGDMTLVDLSRPARWSMSPVRCVAVTFPRALLPLSPDELGRLTAVRVPGDRGPGAPASAFVLGLAGRLGEAGGARLGTALVDVLAVALASRLGRADALPPATRRRDLVRRVHAYIEARLGNPGLTPRAVAAAHHVSVRYLHRLFEAQEATVAELIRRRRLERCRRDLLDPALRREPVAAIGARWGLANPAHFSRAFRAAYGVPPTEYRALVASGDGDAGGPAGLSR